LEEAWSRPGERAVAEQLARTLLARDDLLYRVASRLDKLLASDVASGSRSHTGGWSSRLLPGQGETRTFEVERSGRRWIVQWVGRFWESTVSVDGVKVPLLHGHLTAEGRVSSSAFTDNAVSFLIDGETRVVIRTYGLRRLRGFALYVGGRVLYQEGELPHT
jgi:hypothetical protein